MKISPRLQLIASLVQHHYDDIWDCCCDHGLLGANLLENHPDSTLHFVDVVPDLMQEISVKLNHFYPASAEGITRWQVHCLDVALLPLADNTHRQLIIVAGVGGDLLIRLVEAILKAHPHHHLEFILCPVQHTFAVRKSLQQHKLGLICEHLIEDNRRFYEVLHVSTQSQVKITAIGSQMWDLTRTRDQRYLHKTLSHYQRIQTGSQNKLMTQKVDSLNSTDFHTELSTIIEAYQALLAMIPSPSLRS